MKSHQIFFGDVEEHLDVYFKMCSLLVNCREIAHMGAVLANGCLPETGERVITPKGTENCPEFNDNLWNV